MADSRPTSRERVEDLVWDVAKNATSAAVVYLLAVAGKVIKGQPQLTWALGSALLFITVLWSLRRISARTPDSKIKKYLPSAILVLAFVVSAYVLILYQLRVPLDNVAPFLTGFNAAVLYWLGTMWVDARQIAREGKAAGDQLRADIVRAEQAMGLRPATAANGPDDALPGSEADDVGLTP